MKKWSYKNFSIQEFEELVSTNSLAYEMAAGRQIISDEIILARTQISGKGRVGRNWESPRGNLYFSLVLRPKILSENIAEISFVSAVALRLAIEKFSKKLCENKWPNDLILDGKKVAGILLESKISGINCEFVVIGIGVNISSHPKNTIFPATSLSEDISPQDFLQKFLDEFEKIYAIWLNFGFAKIRNLWIERAFFLGKNISVRLSNEVLEGIFKDIDDSGNLVIRVGNKDLKISAADVGVI